MHEALRIYQEVMPPTEPDKLYGLTRHQMEVFYNSLHAARQGLLGGIAEERCDRRLELLRREIELKRTEERSERQHQENSFLGQKTLFWAKVGGIAAAIGTFVLLFQDMPISKLLRAISSRASPKSSPQLMPTAAQSETPTAAESPLATPQALETPSPSATPTPQKYPPPAP
jgi:hypothetical protein